MNTDFLSFDPTNLASQEMMDKVINTLISILVQHIRLEAEYCKNLETSNTKSGSDKIQNEYTYYKNRISEMTVIASYMAEMTEELYGDIIVEAKRLSGTPDYSSIYEDYGVLVCYPDWGSDYWISVVEKNAKPSWFLSCVYIHLKRYIIYEQNRWREGSEASRMKESDAFRDAANDVGGLLLGIVYSWLMKARASEAGIAVPNEEITEAMFNGMVASGSF